MTDQADAEVVQPDEGAPIDSPAGGEGAEGATVEDKAALADFPEDWRDRMAEGDEKELKRLGRFNSPTDLFKSYRAMESKLNEADRSQPLPENATEDQIAKFRKDNGIPDDPKGYLDNLPDGLVLGEGDEPLVNAFLENAHAQNTSPEVVGNFMNWYFAQQEQHTADQAEEDQNYKKDSEDLLRNEWGPDYRQNIQLYEAAVEGFPEEVREKILQGRFSDGSVIGNNPYFIRHMAALQREINPAATVVPGGGGSNIETVQEEIAKIEQTMRADRGAYNKDTKMQERYRTLLTARDRLKAA